MPRLSGRVLLALVPLVVVPLTALPAAGEGRTTPPTSTVIVDPPAPGAVTLVGTVREYAGVSPTGADLHHHTLHTRIGVFDLVAPALELPVTGTAVAATGVLDGDTLTATAVQVLEEVSARARAVTRARTSGTTKSLVMRVYWKGGAPAKPTTAVTKEAFLTDSDRWFREVSAGEYGVKGKVTPWLKLKRKPSCASPDNVAMREALGKAKKKGFNPQKFDRYVLYLPCSTGFVSGYANLPGKNVWMFGNTSRSVIMHEQGHNLGLNHANHRFCKSSGLVTTFSGRCSVFEYGDPFDAMGNRTAGHFSAFSKKKLGWAKTTTLTGSGTKTLAPYVGGGGIKGLRIKVSRNLSYWLEYRTKVGFDAGFASPDGYGVQIRRVSGRYTEVVDALPGSGDGFVGDEYVEEIDAAALGVGSSVTTPEGIRIQTVSQNAGGATIKVTFKAGAAKAPATPTAVTADPAGLDAGAVVSWDKPDDRGAVISRYVVTASPGGVSKNVSPTAGTRQSVRLNDLSPGQLTTVTVKAVNEAGTSAGGTTTVTPVAIRPVVSITSPSNGAVFDLFEDNIPVTVDASVGGGKAIDFVELIVDGDEDFPYDYGFEPPFTTSWYAYDTKDDQGVGFVQLRVRAYDTDGNSTLSDPVTVEVRDPFA